MTNTADRPIEPAGPSGIVTTATAIRSQHGYLYTYAEGGDGWGELSALTRLWEASPADASAKIMAEKAAEMIGSPVEVVMVQVSLTVVGPVG